jgi:D-arabinose 1-dehydrogenase-like Zn-dependent alcohol dehydrogenase
MIAPAAGLASIPDGLSAVKAAPLMCAGVTTFNARRHGGRAWVGGLGHLGIQFASKMGFQTIAIARRGDKSSLAPKLGAQHYIDSQVTDTAAGLARMGGAHVILAAPTSGTAMSAVLGGLALGGKFVVVGASAHPRGPIDHGSPSGTSIDSQDTLAFSALSGVRPMTEAFPLERAAEGYEHMVSGKARFRVLLTTG